MNISIVIPTANRPDTIARAIEKIYDNLTKPHEVIVVDQSQDQQTFSALKQFIDNNTVIYLKDTGTGASRARNIGWHHATGEIVAFTDDDAWVDSKWLETITNTFQRNDLNIGMMGGKIIPVYEQREPEWTIPSKWEYVLPAYDQGDVLGTYPESKGPASVNCSIRRSLLEQYGGFNEDFGPNIGRTIPIYGEDADLTERVRKDGFDIIYNPECIVYHPVPLTRQNPQFLLQRLKAEGATYAYLRIKNQELNTLECFLSFIKTSLRYVETFFNGNQEDISYLYGKMFVLFKCGLLKLEI